MLRGWLMFMGLVVFYLAAYAGENETRPSEGTKQKLLISEPKGWRDFKWGITIEKARQLGAKPFKDREGTGRFGLPDVELLPGKRFWVDLGFFSHIRLASLLVHMDMLGVCEKDAYKTLLQNLREKHGKEKESKNLDYPNAWFLSHTWVFGATRIELNHSCSKPASSNSSFLTNIQYERRRHIEFWNP